MDMKKIYDQMLERAQEDENFKNSLLKDAKTTLKNELGIDFGNETEVEVFQSTSEHQHFVLPVNQNA